MFNVLDNLIKVIKKRKKYSINISYTSFLLSKGRLFVSKKLNEEFLELIEAVKKNNKKNIIHESADLIYHFLVLLEINNIKLKKILLELKKRQNQSGIEEKKNRKKNVR